MLKFSLNLLDDLKPAGDHPRPRLGRAGAAGGWRGPPDKQLYVWFDAVIGYLSASIEWAARTGDPDAWRPWWQDAGRAAYYFMGKDNIVFHAEIWPAMLFGYSGMAPRRAARPARRARPAERGGRPASS